MPGSAHPIEYQVYRNIKVRCRNPRRADFHLYGGRGIKCLYKNFKQFYEDVGPRPSPQHSIDRINNNKHYEPGNVRWATRIEQANNKRNNRWFSFQGRTLTLTQWAKEIGVLKSTLYVRMYYLQWSVEKALTTPVGKR